MTRDAEWYRNYRATRQGPIPHGTNKGYAGYRCRCPECREAHADAAAEYRARRRESVTAGNDTNTPI